ncbi:MAG: spermidine/putrescine ABC transporter substrate-binding protein [Acidobacteria bacterium]|nr:spermidine/putrescine ABC transporter substrate-binding protein [Acidobacteriota bacterium]
MNRRAFVLALPALAGCGRRGRPRLNVFNWSNYVAPDTVPRFEAEAGVGVRYAVYESNEELLARVMSGNSGWDLVFPSNYIVEPLREMNLLARLRQDWLPNLDNLDPRFRAPEWDPGLAWSVPYMWGGCGILYNRRLDPPPARWADLWNARLRGRVTMLDDPGEVLGACLQKLGFPLNSTDPGQLDAARREALAQKPILRAYLNAEVRDQAVAGDVLAAQMWATTAQQAMDASRELAFAYPAEGFSLYADTAVVLRESRRPELAHRFIDYLLRPQVGAAIVTASRTATTNRAALELLPETVRNSPTLYPSPKTLRRGEWQRALPPAAQRLRDRLWTEIKST